MEKRQETRMIKGEGVPKL